MTEKKKPVYPLFKLFWRTWPLQWTLNYERMEALGYCFAMIPIINKLYEGEEKNEWLKLHLEFYNTTPYTHPLILGIDVALEEQGATQDTVRAVKTGLIGPLAGIGDAAYWFTLVPICFGIGASIGQDGNILGPIVALALWIPLAWGSKYWLLLQGYTYGSDIAGMLQTGQMEQFKTILNAFGMGMAGALTALFVNVQTPLKLFGEFEGETVVIFNLQETLDAFIGPALLSLVFVLFTFWLLRRGWSILKVFAIIWVVGLVLGIIGIIGGGGLLGEIEIPIIGKLN
jgi:PTS system mannose-specific IID component